MRRQAALGKWVDKEEKDKLEVENTSCHDYKHIVRRNCVMDLAAIVQLMVP